MSRTAARGSCLSPPQHGSPLPPPASRRWEDFKSAAKQAGKRKFLLKNTPGVQQGTRESTCSALPKRCSSGLLAARLHLRRTMQSTQTSRGRVPSAATLKALRMELRHHRRAPATTGETMRCCMRPILYVRPWPFDGCVGSQPRLKHDLVIDRRGASRPVDKTSPPLQRQRHSGKARRSSETRRHTHTAPRNFKQGTP